MDLYYDGAIWREGMKHRKVGGSRSLGYVSGMLCQPWAPLHARWLCCLSCWDIHLLSLPCSSPQDRPTIAVSQHSSSLKYSGQAMAAVPIQALIPLFRCNRGSPTLMTHNKMCYVYPQVTFPSASCLYHQRPCWRSSSTWAVCSVNPVS